MADVQLTKDHVPVIYHDFLVSETGIDAPVHTLTLEQVCLSCNQLEKRLLTTQSFYTSTVVALVLLVLLGHHPRPIQIDQRKV